MRNLEPARTLWKALGDVPVDENGCIERDFMHFKEGTPREEIWEWFELNYDCSVRDDLMFPAEQKI